MGEKSVEPLALADAHRLIELRELIHPEEAESSVWGDAAKRLRKLGFDLLVPLQGPSTLLGILALAVRRSKETGNFDPEFLSTLLGQAGIAIEHVRTIRRLEDQTFRVTRTLIGLVERRIGKGQMASTELVTFYTGRLADVLNYEGGRRRDLLYGTVLRDVGMIEISDLVLRSPRTLSPEEWKLIQRHPISGADLLRAMEFSQTTCDVVLHHHERFNGQGYPEGLRGGAIPLGARMVSVVESFVAMTRETPYRAALSKDEALAVLQENWQMRYDPVVVDAFLPIARDVSPQDEDLTVERLLVG